MYRCNQHMGDNDATNPQIVCIRGAGHPGPCDNVRGDWQVWATAGARIGAGFPVSYAYASRHDAQRVFVQAERLLPGLYIFMMDSEHEPTGAIDYGQVPRCLDRAEADELLRRFGW